MTHRKCTNCYKGYNLIANEMGILEKCPSCQGFGKVEEINDDTEIKELQQEIKDQADVIKDQDETISSYQRIFKEKNEDINYYIGERDQAREERNKARNELKDQADVIYKHSHCDDIIRDRNQTRKELNSLYKKYNELESMYIDVCQDYNDLKEQLRATVIDKLKKVVEISDLKAQNDKLKDQLAKEQKPVSFCIFQCADCGKGQTLQLSNQSCDYCGRSKWREVNV